MLSINLGFLARRARQVGTASGNGHTSASFEARDSASRANALMARAQDGWSAGILPYLIRVIFWPPQMPMAQPSTRMVRGSISRRCPA